MKKILSLGLVLLTIVYALPLAYRSYAKQLDAAISQDSVSVAAKAEVPTESDTDAAETDKPAEVPVPATGGETEITVLVDGAATKMPLETYVAGVVAAEVSPSFPADALRAQAVAARTYAVYKMRGGTPAEQHKGAAVCDDFHHCTAYVPLATEASARWGGKADTYRSAIEQAVTDTAGEILTVDGAPIVAVFSCASGAKTEAAADVWGSEISYLQSVTSPGGDACPKYNADVTVSAADFRKKVKETFPTADVSGAPNTWFKASVRSTGGSVKTVQLGGVRVEGTAVRTLFALNSANFTITPAADSITFHTVGYGHGVGMSQYGAKYMAEHDQNYRDILAHYYTGTTLTKI